MALMENGLVVSGKRPLLRLLLPGSFPLRKVLFLFFHISVHNFRDGIHAKSAGDPKLGMVSITLEYCILLYLASYCCSFLCFLYHLLDEDCSPNEYSYTKASKVWGM